MSASRREVLLGDEAVGLGAIDAGLSGVYGYPGTPSTEIFEFIEARTRKAGNVHAFWSTNEKVAYEEALGMSWAGKRAMVTMKHVGVNVAADAFMNSAVTGVKGGLVLAVADDPGMHSSQNEQDSRFYAQFAQVPCFEPANQQDAYDMMAEAFALSERLAVPVMVRLVTRLAHSRAAVRVDEARAQNPLEPARDKAQWTLLPVNARAGYRRLLDKQPAMVAAAEASRWTRMEIRGRRGVIACGVAQNYLRECIGEQHELSILDIGQYPIPVGKVRSFFEHVDEVLLLEDGYPLLESALLGVFGVPGKTVKGRLSGDVPRDGELDPDVVARSLGMQPAASRAPGITLAARPPALCKGCPHTDTFKSLNEALAKWPRPHVFSDIGCYTLAALPPLEAIHSCVDMGASIGMAAGAAHAGHRPAVAAIGDSTFAHGGLTSLLSVVQQRLPVTVFILDNGTVAMTGTQRSMGTGEALDELVRGAGIDPAHLKVIEPLPKHHVDNVRVIAEELAYEGPSVIIARRECLESRKH